MDFMRMLRSLEELLYEVMTWLVFYPRTFFLTLFRPLKTLEYCRQQFHREEAEQFDRSLSPPLFLLLSILLSHLLQLVIGYDPLAQSRNPLAHASEQNLVVIRSLMFALFPLVFALHHVRVTKLELSHATLRAPFFIECYPAAVYILIFQLGFTLSGAFAIGHIAGALLWIAATGWYLAVETAWISRSMPRGRAFLVALWQWFKAVLLVFAVAAAITYGGGHGS
jgi:hypothetical protein